MILNKPHVFPSTQKIKYLQEKYFEYLCITISLSLYLYISISL